MFKNKHVLAALVITPILAILGYFAVDSMVSETPHAAVPGQSYELVARSSCRYASGHCVLANGDFEIDIEGEFLEDGRLTLSVVSAFPLQGAKVAVVDGADQTGRPLDFRAIDNSNRQWIITISRPATENSILQLAVSANNTLYFGETGLAFTAYETGFGEDFRGANQ